MTKEKGFLFLSIVIFSAILGYFVLAWDEPGSTPPGGNIDTPLNVGSTAQIKTGDLTVGDDSETDLTIRENLIVEGSTIKVGTGGAGYVYLGNRGYYIGDDLGGSDIQTNASDFYVYDGGWKRLLKEGDVSVPNLNGWSFQDNKFLDDGQDVIQAYDSWLRLNQSGHFTLGIYSPGKIRADGGLYVSDDEYFYRNSEDFIRTGDHFQSDASVRAPIFYDSNNTGYYVNPASVSRLNDIRPNIMYDGNDTSYYVDPAGTSKFSTINLGGVSRSSWPAGITSESDTLQTVTNRGRVTTQIIRSPRFEDYNNTGFYLDPASTSYLNDVRASILYDRDNTGYYVNPAGTSKFSTINLGGVSRSSWPASGSGTANYLSKWTTGTTLGNSVIYDNGTNVGIGTTAPGTAKLKISGGVIDMSSQKITNLANPTVATDAATKSYVDSATSPTLWTCEIQRNEGVGALYAQCSAGYKLISGACCFGAIGIGCWSATGYFYMVGTIVENNRWYCGSTSANNIVATAYCCK